MISVLGAAFIAVAAIGVAMGKPILPYLLAASAAFSTSAAVTVAGNGISPFHLLAAIATVAAVGTWAKGRHYRHPAMRPFVLLCVVAVLVTAVAPTFFAGIPILSPRAGIDDQVLRPTPLEMTPSMYAQVAYLIVGVGAVAYLLQREALRPGIVTLALFLGTALSSLRLIDPFAPTLDSVFRNSESAGYLYYTDRAFGIYAEPSYLAAYSLAAVSFAAFRVGAARGLERAGVLAILVLAPVNLVMSASGTAALGTVLTLAAVGAYYGWRFLFDRLRVPPRVMLLALAIFAVAIIPNPLSRGVMDTIEEKSESASFANRFASDEFSWSLLLDTYGIGVGLGASRPSSFATLVLSNLGVIGFVLLAIAIARALRLAVSVVEWRPAAIGLVALLVGKVLAEPALSTPLLWLLLGACVHAGRTCIASGGEVRQRLEDGGHVGHGSGRDRGVGVGRQRDGVAGDRADLPGSRDARDGDVLP